MAEGQLGRPLWGGRYRAAVSEGRLWRQRMRASGCCRMEHTRAGRSRDRRRTNRRTHGLSGQWRQRRPSAPRQGLAKRHGARPLRGICRCHVGSVRTDEGRLLLNRGRQRRGDCKDAGAMGGSGGGRHNLTTAILDGHNIRGVIDDERVVDVVEDHVVGRRRHIDRRITPRWNRHEHRDREHESFDRGRRLRQYDEFGWWRRQEIDRRRRRRCEAEVRIVEREHRAIDIDSFFGRWGRHIVVDLGE